MRLGHYLLLHTVLLMFIVVETYSAEYDICPAGFGEKIQDVFGASNYIQQGLRHRVPCPSFRQGEKLEGVIWFKGPTTADEFRVLSRSVSEIYPTSDRYEFAPDTVSLVIRGVEKDDEGRYSCQVIPQETGSRVEEMDLHVLGESFPASNGVTSSAPIFQRGHRQTLPCQCASPTPDAPISVVYWSTGEGVTTDIIAARFSDGTTLKFKYGADYSIGSDALSLQVTSLQGVHDNQRYWCHVFLSDDTLASCFTDIQISDEEPDHAFKADPSSFYLLKGAEQFVPCTSWTRGNTTCEIRWFKIDTSGRHLLLSSNDVGADSAFDLTSEFGLIINSVDDEHAGKYRCDAGPEASGDIYGRVIGDRFPLDGGRVLASSTFTFKDGKLDPLTCMAASNTSEIGLPSKTILFWSFGAPDEQSTIVIGRLNLLDGSKTLSDLGDDSCFDISSEGSLLLTNCSQDGDVRYWCHVFPENEFLIRSYVNAVVDSAIQPFIVIIIVVGICGSLLGLIVGIYLCRGRFTRSYDPVSGVETQATPSEGNIPLETVQQDTRRTDGLLSQFNDLETQALYFVKCRKKTIQMLRETADQLQAVYEKTQVAQVVGGAAGIVGSAFVVTGLAASFFTFGFSLALTAIGASLGAAGGATTIGGTMIEWNASKEAEEKAKKILADDNEASEQVQKGLEKVDITLKILKKGDKGALKIAGSIYDFVRVGTAASKMGKAVGQPAFKVAGAVGKGVALGGVLFSVLSIPLDIHTIITSSENLQNDTVQEVAQAIYKIVEELDCPTEEEMKRKISQIRGEIYAE